MSHAAFHRELGQIERIFFRFKTNFVNTQKKNSVNINFQKKKRKKKSIKNMKEEKGERKRIILQFQDRICKYQN